MTKKRVGKSRPSLSTAEVLNRIQSINFNSEACSAKDNIRIATAPNNMLLIESPTNPFVQLVKRLDIGDAVHEAILGKFGTGRLNLTITIDELLSLTAEQAKSEVQ